MSELIFNFESEEQRERFTAWLLDGGGEDSLAEYCEIRDEEFMGFDMVKPSLISVE